MGERTRCTQEGKGVIPGAEEEEMKSPVVETFLVGVACGIGITVLSLYTQRPSFFVAAADSITDRGRARKEKRERDKFIRKRLKAMGFSNKEINENL